MVSSGFVCLLVVVLCFDVSFGFGCWWWWLLLIVLLSFLYFFLIGLVCDECSCLALVMLVVGYCLLWFGCAVVYSCLLVWLGLCVGLLCCF